MHITNWKKGVDGITNSMDESEQILGGSEAWVVKPGVLQSMGLQSGHDVAKLWTQ